MSEKQKLKPQLTFNEVADLPAEVAKFYEPDGRGGWHLQTEKPLDALAVERAILAARDQHVGASGKQAARQSILDSMRARGDVAAAGVLALPENPDKPGHRGWQEFAHGSAGMPRNPRVASRFLQCPGRRGAERTAQHTLARGRPVSASIPAPARIA